MQRFVQWRLGDAIVLGEANVPPSESNRYFGKNGEGLQMMFNFYVNQYLFYALATGKTPLLVKALQETREKPATAQWAYFLRNHDEIDLGRLTEQQRNEVYRAMGPDTSMQLFNRGIRRRLAPMLNNDRKRIEMAYSLLLSLPGTPVIRYGEEIGMGDDLQLRERLSIRTPMQWSSTRNAGFTTAEKPFRPVISNGEYGYQKVNVALQQRTPGSLLNWLEKMIRLRRQCPEIGLGSWEVLNTGAAGVLALHYRYKEKELIVLHNFSAAAQQVTLPAAEGSRLYDLLSGAALQPAATLSLNGYGYKWLRVGKNNE
jgi:maltose alpha-D-glucosyltransferase/alpha-amylase